MKFNQFIPIYLLFFFFSFKTNAQVESKINSGLEWYYKTYPPEKVYAQTDKYNYIAGQTLWFSIYSISFGVPNDLSKIVYLQLISLQKGNVITQTNLPIDGGMSHGNILLPDSLKTGVYELRCFTEWMLNFDEHSIFHKAIYVQNITDQGIQYKIKHANINHSYVDFFPEGGDLIAGNPCKVAFKAIDSIGLPVEIRGEIYDEKGDSIARLQTFHDGMGEFTFTPAKQHQYFAKINFPDGTMITKKLPVAFPFGLTLKVIGQNDSEIKIAIFYHPADSAGLQKNLLLTAYQCDGRYVVYPILIEEEKNIFSIKKTQFSTGILRLTLFNLNNIPLAERIVFLNKNDFLKISLLKDSLSFKPRAKNEFYLKIENGIGAKDSARFSVAVTDADKVAEDSSNDNIFSALLLSPELNGYIYHPAYYFLNNYDTTQKALDLVMLTNGWRHFKWENILAQKPCHLKYSIEREPYIAGEIIDYKIDKYKPMFKLRILIQNEDSSKFIGYAEPDSNGRFILKNYSVKGRSTIFFEGAKKKSKAIKVQFFTSPENNFLSVSYAPLLQYKITDSNAINDKDEINQILQRQKGITLKPVVVKGDELTSTQQLIKKYVSNDFVENNATTIDFINNFYSNNNRIFEFLKGRIPGLNISGTEDDPKFTYEGSFPQLPYFFVNEIPTSWEEVKNILFSNISLLQYLPSPVTMAPLNGGYTGAISIYLKKGDGPLPIPLISKNQNRFTFNGFSITREFYSPDYSFQDSTMPASDFRSTLYWSPNLKIDSNGIAHFHFYNSDDTKRFRVIIEGMNAQGKVGRLQEIFTGN
ncbi:MAG TPA: hypothetical protein VIJ95_16280 [Hanamia sp.]